MEFGVFLLLLLYLLGLGLCLVEIFVPSGGVLGISAALCIGYSLWELYSTGHGLLAGLCVILTAVYLFLLIRWGLQRLRLDRSLAGGQATGADVLEATSMVGTTGKAVTPLRPAGVAQFDGRRFDVVTQGDFVEVGAPVEVVRTDGNRILVRGS